MQFFLRFVFSKLFSNFPISSTLFSNPNVFFQNYYRASAWPSILPLVNVVPWVILRASRPGYSSPKSDPDPWAGPRSKMGPKRVKNGPFFTIFGQILSTFHNIYYWSWYLLHFIIKIGDFFKGKKAKHLYEKVRKIYIKNYATFSTKFLDPDSDP